MRKKFFDSMLQPVLPPSWFKQTQRKGSSMRYYWETALGAALLAISFVERNNKFLNDHPAAYVGMVTIGIILIVASINCTIETAGRKK